MRELERTIIGACYGESQYQRVAFLEPKDFTVIAYSRYFQLIQANKGNMPEVFEMLRDADETIKSEVFILTTLSGANQIENFALKLLEMRFKRLLIVLLGDLSIKTKNSLERDLLIECQSSVLQSDIFDLSDNMLEYIGIQASEYTKCRIGDFLKYRDERSLKAKEIINNLNK